MCKIQFVQLYSENFSFLKCISNENKKNKENLNVFYNLPLTFQRFAFFGFT